MEAPPGWRGRCRILRGCLAIGVLRLLGGFKKGLLRLFQLLVLLGPFLALAHDQLVAVVDRVRELLDLLPERVRFAGAVLGLAEVDFENTDAALEFLLA